MTDDVADRLEKAGAAADTYADCTTPVQTCPLDKAHWLEVQMVGEDGAGIAGQRYELELPDGTRMTGRTDANGVLAARGFTLGSRRCVLSFPDLDGQAWELIR